MDAHLQRGFRHSAKFMLQTKAPKELNKALEDLLRTLCTYKTSAVWNKPSTGSEHDFQSLEEAFRFAV